MGILETGPLGPFRKKVGPVTGRKHMGQNLILSAYRKTTKKPTDLQLEQQLKFGLLNSFLSNIDLLVNDGFKAHQKKNSAINAAFSFNFDHAFVLLEGGWELNYPQLVYSRGDIVAPGGPAVSRTAGGVFFSWEPQQQSWYCQFSDRATFLVYDPERGKAYVARPALRRDAYGFEMALPGNPGTVLHGYMSFSSADGKLTGESVYVGELN